MKLFLCILLNAILLHGIFIKDSHADFFGFQLTDTTLSKSDSPHLIIGDWEISAGVTVTIEPGVVIQFKKNSDILGGNDYPTLSELIIEGTLIGVGNSTDSIWFQPDSSVTVLNYALVILKVVFWPASIVVDRSIVRIQCYGPVKICN